MESGLLISDAAKEVQVESHVLRYWEEELELPIRRNEQGHRYYTNEDVACFKQIKVMKERGLQLKAIKLILKDGKFDILPSDQMQEQVLGQASEHMSHPSGQASEHVLQQMSGQTSEHVPPQVSEQMGAVESKEEKTQRLQWVLRQMICQAVQENNAELVQQIRESVLKELDYQFRLQEEREEERDRKAMERAEQHYRQVDDLLRIKSRRRKISALTDTVSVADVTNAPKEDHAMAEEQTLEEKTEDKKSPRKWFVFAGKTKSKKMKKNNSNEVTEKVQTK